jgi:hypothetical protein
MLFLYLEISAAGRVTVVPMANHLNIIAKPGEVWDHEALVLPLLELGRGVVDILQVLLNFCKRSL